MVRELVHYNVTNHESNLNWESYPYLNVSQMYGSKIASGGRILILNRKKKIKILSIFPFYLIILFLIP